MNCCRKKERRKESPITKRIRNERVEPISHSLRKTNGISPRVAPLLEREQTAAARSNSRCIYAIKKARMHVGTWDEAGGLLNSCRLPRPIAADHLNSFSFFLFSFFFSSLPHLHVINLRERACTHLALLATFPSTFFRDARLFVIRRATSTGLRDVTDRFSRCRRSTWNHSISRRALDEQPGQVKLFQRVFENWSVLENCVRYFIFRDIQKKKKEEKEKRGVLSLSTHLYICSHRNR